jgi:hypothetical protein
MQAEISYDLVMEDDMDFVEGCYRLSGKPWEVFIFSKERERKLAEPSHQFGKWESGVTGIELRVPYDTKLNKSVVQDLLSAALGVSEWHEVRGPDSMKLR